MAKRSRTTHRTSISNLDLGQLHAELRRRTTVVKRLQRKRGTLARRIAALDHQIASLGGSVSGGRRGAGGGRPRNDMNLVDALAKVIGGKTMGVTEVAEAVQKAGYVTTSANFRTIVNATLIKHKDTFKNVARGQYTTK